MPTILALCGILPLPSLLVRALAPKQLFGLKEDTGTGPRSPSGFTSGTHGLSSSDGRLLLNRPFAHPARSPRHKGLRLRLVPRLVLQAADLALGRVAREGGVEVFVGFLAQEAKMLGLVSGHRLVRIVLAKFGLVVAALRILRRQFV